MKHISKVICAVSALILLTSVLCMMYILDYYPANETAISALNSNDDISVEFLEDQIIFSPSLPKAGFVFYPGGKVEFTAYSPLMKALAEQNIICVLLKMPCNLAVLDADAADGIIEQYPDVDRWYIGGHSLGGSMAASYASKVSSEFEGLVLLASYSTADLSGTSLRVISLFGTEDGVLNQEKYYDYKTNLPHTTVETVIEGGNHAYFGSYDQQDGDGTARISPREQILLTSDALADFFLE